MSTLRALPIVCACALVALALPGSSAPATKDLFPAFFVQSDAQGLGGTANVTFTVNELDSAADSERLAISVPSGYGADLVHAVGRVIGTGDVTVVPEGGGGQTAFSGKLVEMSPVAYTADPNAATCAPGSHAAYWEIDARTTTDGGIDVPIAVDRSAGGGYEMTMCFDAQHAQRFEIWGLDFTPQHAFSTPTHAGNYLFDATVTPFAADGTPSTSTAYELRAYEPLPHSLSIAATYHRSSATLTITGRLATQGKSHGGAVVEAWRATSPTAAGKRYPTTATTGASGKYAFALHLAAPPRFVWVQVEATAYETCSGSSPDPGGCASYSVDGTSSSLVSVTVTK